MGRIYPRGFLRSDYNMSQSYLSIITWHFMLSVIAPLPSHEMLIWLFSSLQPRPRPPPSPAIILILLRILHCQAAKVESAIAEGGASRFRYWNLSLLRRLCREISGRSGSDLGQASTLFRGACREKQDVGIKMAVGVAVGSVFSSLGWVTFSDKWSLKTSVVDIIWLALG